MKIDIALLFNNSIMHPHSLLNPFGVTLLIPLSLCFRLQQMMNIRTKRTEMMMMTITMGTHTLVAELSPESMNTDIKN